MRERLAAAVAVIVAAVVAAGCTLPVADLGGATSEGYDINDAGVVVGVSELAGSSTSHAFKRRPDGTAVDLGTLAGTTSSVAIEINDAGVTVGWSEGGGPRRVVVWDDADQIHDLGFDAMPFDMNEAGVVVGLDLAVPGRQGRAAFVYDPVVGHAAALPELPGTERSEAWGVNDAGQAVGTVQVDGAGWIPVRWDLAAGTVTDLRPISQLLFATDIADDGTIVGVLPDLRAGIWSPGDGAATPISDVQAAPMTIGDDGTVVGYTPYTPEAFRWHATTGFEWLGNDGEQSQARGVNDHGQVVGSAGGRAVLLFPRG